MHLFSCLSWLAVGASAVSFNNPSKTNVGPRSADWDDQSAPKAVGYYGNWVGDEQEEAFLV